MDEVENGRSDYYPKDRPDLKPRLCPKEYPFSYPLYHLLSPGPPILMDRPLSLVRNLWMRSKMDGRILIVKDPPRFDVQFMFKRLSIFLPFLPCASF